MRTRHFRLRVRTISVVVSATLAVATLANSATAQTASPVLNALEVQKLVASTDPSGTAADCRR